MNRPEPGFAWPLHTIELRAHNQRTEVYDTLRRRWLMLTPEEFVRQQLLQHLMQDLHVPAPLIAVERGVRVAGRRRRFDILVYNRSGKPHLLAECKHPDLRIGPDAVRQAAQYNDRLGARWLVLTNGTELWVFSRRSDSTGYDRQHALPDFSEST